MFNIFKKTGLTDEQKGICEYYFEDEPNKTVTEIAKEMGVNPNQVKSHKGVWARAQPKTTKETKSLTTELNKFVRMKEDIDNFQRVFGGGDGDSTSATINAITDLVNSEGVADMVNNIVNSRINLPQPQPQPEEVLEVNNVSKEEQITQYAELMRPHTKFLNKKNMAAYFDRLPEPQKEQIRVVFEFPEDVENCLNTKLGLNLSHKILDGIYHTLHPEVLADGTIEETIEECECMDTKWHEKKN